jgi:hypothetical protein
MMGRRQEVTAVDGKGLLVTGALRPTFVVVAAYHTISGALYLALGPERDVGVIRMALGIMLLFTLRDLRLLHSGLYRVRERIEQGVIPFLRRPTDAN